MQIIHFCILHFVLLYIVFWYVAELVLLCTFFLLYIPVLVHGFDKEAKNINGAQFVAYPASFLLTFYTSLFGYSRLSVF